MFLTLLVHLIIVGLVLWLVNALLPIDYRIKQVIWVLGVIYIILVVLAAFGVQVPILDRLIV